jgi:DNA-binding CsgD family transcriptional regulator
MGKSTRMRLPEIRAVFRLLNEVVELRADPAAGRRHMVVGLCGLVGARQGAALRWQGFSPRGELRLLEFVPGGWASAAASRLWEGLMRQPNWRGDPILDVATRVRGRVVTCLRRQLVPDREWYASEVANVVAKCAEIDPHLVCWYRKDTGTAYDEVTGVALHRAWGDRDFGERDRQLLHLFNEELFRLDRAGRIDPLSDPASVLTPRQRAVLKCLLGGDSEKEAARRLGVSRFTLNDHVKAIYRRLGVSSRGELGALFLSGLGGMRRQSHSVPATESHA